MSHDKPKVLSLQKKQLLKYRYSHHQERGESLNLK
jgi:hypothetical protein